MQPMLMRILETWGGQARVCSFGPISLPYVHLPQAGAQEPLVFFPPLGEGWSSWFRLLAELRAVAPCYALDPPYRAAEGSNSVYRSVETIAEWVEAANGMLEALDLTRVHLVGSSLGAIVAMRVARRAPSRIRGVYALSLRPDLDSLAFLRSSFAVTMVDDVHRLLDLSWAEAPALPEDACLRLTTVFQSRAFRLLLEEVSGASPLQEAKQTLAAGIATAFLSGQRDRLLPRPANPGPGPLRDRWHEFAQCGHYPHLERPRDCANWLRCQLSRPVPDIQAR